MNKLRDLYQEVIIDHNRSPRNFCVLPNANRITEGFNPLCGDKLTLYLIIENNTITNASFKGSGCAISTASASLMTEQLEGKDINAAIALFEKFHYMLTHKIDRETDLQSLGKLAVLIGVRDYPTRIKCATLAWHTLKAALEGKEQPISTE